MAKRDDPRNVETRDRLVESAIELFGLVGYDGTSTRAIASKAGASLGAIPYHFKTKECLYLAAARSIAEQVSLRLGPVLSAFESDIYSDELSRKKAISLLEEIFTPFVTMLASNDSEKWARFTLREQAAPTKAFEILYASDIGRFFRAVIHLAAIASGDVPASQSARIRGMTLVGQALAFRAARALSLRTLELEDLGAKEITLITATIRENIRLLQYV
ncbi:MAG: CerR family C-terminal domain-containing protein [Hyphomonas sp.]|jgi:TetR/AcrR family transcriptional regulator, regulator of cefoperazone and chloramphenicol sensitivity